MSLTKLYTLAKEGSLVFISSFYPDDKKKQLKIKTLIQLDGDVVLMISRDCLSGYSSELKLHGDKITQELKNIQKAIDVFRYIKWAAYLLFTHQFVVLSSILSSEIAGYTGIEDWSWWNIVRIGLCFLSIYAKKVTLFVISRFLKDKLQGEVISL